MQITKEIICTLKRRFGDNAILLSQCPVWGSHIQIFGGTYRILCIDRTLSGLSRLRLSLPCLQIPGWVKIRNRTLSHRKMFCQASPAYQTGNIFRFCTSPSAKSVIRLLLSLAFTCPVQLGFSLWVRPMWWVCARYRGCWSELGTLWLPLGESQLSMKGKCECLPCCFSHLSAPRPLLCRKDPLPTSHTGFALPFPSPTSDCTLTDYIFSEAVNLGVSSSRISVREVSLGSLQKGKWKVEDYLMWNVVEYLCWASLRGLRLQLPEKADKSSRHPVIQLPSLPRLWPCSAWATQNTQELFLRQTRS